MDRLKQKLTKYLDFVIAFVFGAVVLILVGLYNHFYASRYFHEEEVFDQYGIKLFDGLSFSDATQHLEAINTYIYFVREKEN